MDVNEYNTYVCGIHEHKILRENHSPKKSLLKMAT
jgi:hypothetical protein